MNDAIRAAIKTAVVAIAGWLSARGFNVDSGAIESVLMFLTAGIWNIVLNFVLAKVPWLGTFWKPPTY